MSNDSLTKPKSDGSAPRGLTGSQKQKLEEKQAKEEKRLQQLADDEWVLCRARRHVVVGKEGGFVLREPRLGQVPFRSTLSDLAIGAIGNLLARELGTYFTCDLIA